jgi:hypothetical protein
LSVGKEWLIQRLLQHFSLDIFHQVDALHILDLIANARFDLPAQHLLSFFERFRFDEMIEC